MAKILIRNLFLVGTVSMAIGILGLSIPQTIEGPILVLISEGHGLTLLDLFALIPLILGTSIFELGLWKNRASISEYIQEHPRVTSSMLFGAGFGMGLLIASAFSTFWWWWAIGSILIGIVVIAVTLWSLSQ